ncbi:MAG: ABC transporter ATP-binding protein [Phycisphaerae bacterium]|nr:ABC transporter ATP-binding protein [Phycisphaerae bacterium]
MIELNALTKRFGSPSTGILAVDGVTLKVAKGEVLGFLGPNGAGKSTTMKMVTGFLTPTSGTASVCGHDVVKDPIAVKERIGYLPEGAPAYPDMTPESFLDFCAQVRKMGERARGRIDHVVERVQLSGVLRQPIETLSKGFKRRVGLAQAILHDPDVLILDEPTDGLDPNQKHEVRALIREMAGQKAIVLSTHILEEVEAVCTRAVVIARGRVIADGTPSQLAARSRVHNAVTIAVRGAEKDQLVSELKRITGVRDVDHARQDNGLCRATAIAKHGHTIAGEVGALVKARGWGLEELRVEHGRLDEVFREITQAK